MTGIACHGGLTQIGRVLDHAERAAAKAPVAALVFVGDAMEENVDALCQPGGRARRCATPAPSCSTRAATRPPPRAFREIARLTGGAYLPFDARAAGELARAARRGRRLRRRRAAALEAAGTGAARRLLADLGP